MAERSETQTRMWELIISYGLQDEYERDWLGRIRSRKTRRYLKAEISPELAQAIASACSQIGIAAHSARAAVGAGRAGISKLLSSQQLPADDQYLVAE